MSDTHPTILGPREPWIYFDGNAITALWDWHTEVTVHGQTGDPRQASPFQHAVLSDYSLDEIVTNPITDAYKKHVLCLTIYPDIPVLKSLEHVDLVKAQADRGELLHPPELLQQVTSTRLLALAGFPEALAGLNTDINNKNLRIQADIAAGVGRTYVPPHLRRPLPDVISQGVFLQGLDPAASASDFFELCKYLGGCEVTRYIDRPSNERKGASRNLNQQIDYYHLSYLPFVDGFVTNDAVLLKTARELTATFYPNVAVYGIDEYHSKWIRDRLTA